MGVCGDVDTLTIPDDPEAIAMVLCRDHLDCRDHIGGHDAYIWQARRLLADLRSHAAVEEATRP